MEGSGLIAGYAVLFLFVFSGVETVLQTQKLRGENAKPDDYKKIKFVPEIRNIANNRRDMIREYLNKYDF